jgi:hypothetical protein
MGDKFEKAALCVVAVGVKPERSETAFVKVKDGSERLSYFLDLNYPPVRRPI